MRMTKRLRVFVVAAGVAASVVAFGARPALASATEGMNAVWTTTLDSGQYGAPMSCSIKWTAPTSWNCSAPASSPIAAWGGDCIQTAYVDVAMKMWDVPLAGCSAELVISSWSGTTTCTTTSQGPSCHEVGGTGTFNFTPVLGAPVDGQSVTITASCTPTAGHASVAGAGVLSNGETFTVNGDLSWVGSCTNVPMLNWSGTLTIV